MLKTSDNTLMEALSEALETMTFMMAMPPEDELPVPEESVLVRMDFTGRISGRVELLAGPELIQMAAANVLGMDPDDQQVRDKAVDSFKEILNTTCGLLLPKLAQSPAEVFNVTAPSSENFSTPQMWTEYVDQPDVTLVDVDCQPLAFRLIINT